jgi:hypothetical protein
VPVDELTFIKVASPQVPTTLLAGTHGRGLWTLDLSCSQCEPNRTLNDFDGDGRSDIAVVRDDGSHLVWHKEGSSAGYSSQQFGAEGDRMVPADYDGDGKTDMAVFRPSQEKWYCLMSSTNSLEQTTLGEANDKELSADFDGDGLADKAVYKPSTGYWEVEQSENGHLVFQWGGPNDKPVSVDFTGDGKADYGFFHEDQGMQILNYLDGTTAHQKQFGLEGDLPVSGDYDGDGKADIAFWR